MDQPTNTKDNENQQTLSHDSLELPIRSIIRSRAKKIKEVLIRLIQDIWAKISVQTSTKDKYTLINVIKKGDSNET